MPFAELPETKTVLLVADVTVEDGGATPAEDRRDLEKSSMKTVAAIMDAIGELGLPVMHLQTLEKLSTRAALHDAGDLVLSIYGGERSRNRMALVPAMCEGLSMRFVGPDAFGRLNCQDKELSKRLALQCGLLTPRYQLVRRHADLARLAPDSFPVVVKPNLEGSSIGISRRSLASNAEQMREVATELLDRFQQPVLIEEFVPGREVSYNMIEVEGGAIGHLAEIRLGADPHYFDDRLFCAEEKAAWAEVEVIPLDDGCVASDLEALHRLATSLGHFGYCRVDGKLHDGRFHFIELTPDAWLDPRGAFPLAFTKAGWSYPEVLAKVLASERAARPHRSSSG